MPRWGSRRIYSCLQWGSGGSPELRGPPRSFFSLAKKGFPCLASRIVGSCSPLLGSRVTSEQLSLGNDPMDRARFSRGADPDAAGEEVGSGGCRKLVREMKWAVDMFCIAEYLSVTS